MGMEKIESNDLLMAILVRLPPKSVFRFMCVSKRWKNIVADPFFIQSYGDRKRKERMIAFVQTKHKFWPKRQRDTTNPDQALYRYATNILPLTQINEGHIKEIPDKFGYVLNSSNGLILCCIDPDTYHVLNPLSRTYVSLPRPSRIGIGHGHHQSAGLACLENTRSLVPSYKLVQANTTTTKGDSNMLPIQTYSSTTRKWTKSTLVATGNFELCRSQTPSVFNGVFHWFAMDYNTLAVYNSNNERDNHLQLIVLPFDDESHLPTVTRSSSDDVLWFGAKIEKYCSQFWRMPKYKHDDYRRSTTIEKKEWILMLTISSDSLCKEISEFQQRNTIMSKIAVPTHSKRDIYYIQNSFIGLKWMIGVLAVLRLEGMVCLYNLETKSVESVIDNHQIGGYHNSDSWTWYKKFGMYMEPIALSSYAISDINVY